eukprot:CAMPEP_0198204970 /NCGR_PEP_ID=MMETSP1445-20131203/8456_1 /TAXON_ID=36898 /ORGANISM="Pyramimonas sp., Strain CCMP2087" /LENGTH=541 /DNA_ID=CAMNT_0043877093 /DNA_START=46 /DNA_END=1671 /DNA_ORIENTATION=+
MADNLSNQTSESEGEVWLDSPSGSKTPAIWLIVAASAGVGAFIGLMILCVIFVSAKCRSSRRRSKYRMSELKAEIERVAIEERGGESDDNDIDDSAELHKKLKHGPTKANFVFEDISVMHSNDGKRSGSNKSAHRQPMMPLDVQPSASLGPATRKNTRGSLRHLYDKKRTPQPEAEEILAPQPDSSFDEPSLPPMNLDTDKENSNVDPFQPVHVKREPNSGPKGTPPPAGSGPSAVNNTNITGEDVGSRNGGFISTPAAYKSNNPYSSVTSGPYALPPRPGGPDGMMAVLSQRMRVLAQAEEDRDKRLDAELLAAPLVDAVSPHAHQSQDYMDPFQARGRVALSVRAEPSIASEPQPPKYKDSPQEHSSPDGSGSPLRKQQDAKLAEISSSSPRTESLIKRRGKDGLGGLAIPVQNSATTKAKAHSAGGGGGIMQLSPMARLSQQVRWHERSELFDLDSQENPNLQLQDESGGPRIPISPMERRVALGYVAQASAGSRQQHDFRSRYSNHVEPSRDLTAPVSETQEHDMVNIEDLEDYEES